MKLLEQICVLNQYSLLIWLKDYLKEYNYKNIIVTKDYLIAEGEIPVALVAHLDTVLEGYEKMECPVVLYDEKKDVVHALGGCTLDDRLGVWAIIRILMRGYRPHIILTTDEEIGGLGAQALCKKYKTPPFKTNFLIELDRAHFNDSVYYQCDSRSFEKYINSFGFKTQIGSFSDISIIMDCWEICGVNLSISYYQEHTAMEYALIDDTMKTIIKVCNILKDNIKHKKSFIYKNKISTLKSWNLF